MVSTKTRQIVWGNGAGRCYFCDASLIGDLISDNEDANFGFVAHFVGEKPDRPHGDVVRSPLLADDYRNLMLMCYTHHKLIDVDRVADYPEPVLLEMKRQHEERVGTPLGPGR